MLPNLITLSRLLFAAGFAGAAWFWAGAAPLPVAGFVVLVLIGIFEEVTDTLDGTIARATGQTSQLGGLLDPMCDSLGRLTVYFSLALAGWLPLCVPLVMTGRDIVVAYTRIVQALTGGKTSARWSGKAKAVVQCGGIFATLLLAVGVGLVPDGAIVAGRWTVAGLVMLVTLWSLLDYLRGAGPGMRKMLQREG